MNSQIERLLYLIDITRSEAKKNLLRRKVEELEYQQYLAQLAARGMLELMRS